MSKLLIVESPGKAKHLAALLDKAEWTVIATRGHLRDLPEDRLGIEVSAEFRPQFVALPHQQKVVARLQKAVTSAAAVYLATDPDREGEAIAAVVVEVLKPDLAATPVHRVTFTALTAEAIHAALATPRPLDMALIDAQQARRTVDRLVGYLVSPLACQALHERVSAGRVQSVGLRLVVDRERDIAAFTPQTYTTLRATFHAASGDFTAQLAVVQDKQRLDYPRPFLDRLMVFLSTATFWVQGVRTVTRTRHPPPPFTTATLLQAASNAYGFSPERTMKAAQILYETGTITYLRTASVAVSAEAQAATRAYLTLTEGDAYVPAAAPTYADKAGHPHECHEAIRPTDVTKRPDATRNSDAAKLYDLIWRRFLASQMAGATYEITSVTVGVGKALGQPYPLEFRVVGRRLTFDGYLRRYDELLDEGEPAVGDVLLPALRQGEVLTRTAWQPEQHTTTAPDRYTEASLIKALAARGIARPSTYALVVQMLKDKGYLRLDAQRLLPTDLAQTLCAFLVRHFPLLFDYQYTARLEVELDRIASGATSRLRTLTAFWEKHFSPDLRRAAAQFAPPKPAPSTSPPTTARTCPRCGGALVERKGKYGAFFGCANYPRCKGTSQPPIFKAIARDLSQAPVEVTHGNG